LRLPALSPLLRQWPVPLVGARAEQALQMGWGEPGATEPEAWLDGSSLDLSAVKASSVRVFARWKVGTCEGAEATSWVVTLAEGFPPPAGQEGSDAVAKDDARIVGWATQVSAVSFGANVDASWQHPERALGAAEGVTTAVVPLGEGGSITLGFDAPIADGPGPELAIFENGFSEDFLELGRVSVSSDGEHFARFAVGSGTAAAVGPYARLDATQVGGFAGRYRVGYGTPFDWALLVDEPEVRSGEVDLSAIVAVRLEDVVGDGREQDDFGHVVYDPYPSTQTAGFDLDAVAVLRSAP